MKTYFIVNPNSGNSSAFKTLDRLLKNKDIEYEIISTEYAHHARKIARGIALRGEKCRIFACGGDGTLFDVVNGAVGNKSVEIGVIPCGSGNDYIKYFGKKEDFLCDDNIIDGIPLEVDLIKFQDKYCVNIASIGMDAYVCQQKNKLQLLSRISGNLSYIVSLFITFIFNMGGRFKVRIDDGEFIENDFLFIVAANGRFYGGSFNPTPNSIVNDGFIDLLLLNKVKRYKVITLMRKYQQGKHLSIGNLCKLVHAKRVEVISEKEIPVNLDGELFDSKTAVFEIAEKAIKFIVPSKLYEKIPKSETKREIKTEAFLK